MIGRTPDKAYLTLRAVRDKCRTSNLEEVIASFPDIDVEFLKDLHRKYK